MFLKIFFLMPIFMANFINIAPIAATYKALDEDPWNVKNGKLISSWLEENIYLYAMDWKRAEEKVGVYKEIVLSVKGHERYFSCWQVTTNPVWKPTFDLSDINNDGKKELIVISTSGYGTGAFEQNVHVFRFDKKGSLYDIYVTDPFEGRYQYVKGTLTNKDGIVTVTINIKGKDYIMKAKESGFGFVGEHVGFGSIIRYAVIDNKLTVKMGVSIGYTAGCGYIVMDYVFENKRLTINNVNFKKLQDGAWDYQF